MIFSQYQMVLDGVKTQTRRVVNKGESWSGVLSNGEFMASYEPYIQCLDCPTLTIRTVYTAAGNVKYRVGQNYAIVPKRGEAGVGHFEMVSIRMQPLKEITEADAKAEGVANVAAYVDLWESINGRFKGRRWADNPFVWAYEIKHRNMNYGLMLQGIDWGMS